MNRYKKFGINTHPLNGSKFNWNNKSKTETTNKLRESKILIGPVGIEPTSET